MLPSNAFKNDKFDSNELAALDSSCVRIYFQLGSSQAFAVCRPDSDNFQESEQPPESSAGSLQLFGLESRCLCQDSVDLISPLRMLLTAAHNMENFLLEQEVSKKNSVMLLAPQYDNITTIRAQLPFVMDEDRDWNDLNLDQLKSYCREKNIRRSGKYKSEIVNMLVNMGRAIPG